MQKFIKTKNNESGILTALLSDVETSVIHVSPVPAQAPGFITLDPGTSDEEEIYYETRDAGAGTISTITRDTSNLNGGSGREHQSQISWETMQSASYINEIVEGILEEHNTDGTHKGQFVLYGADAGGDDDYEITLDPVPGAYTDGMVVVMKPATANTGAATFKITGLSPIAIKKNVSVALETGDILAGQDVVLVYDGTYFQLVTAGFLSKATAVEINAASDDAKFVTSNKLKAAQRTVTAYTPSGAGTTTLDLALGNVFSVTMPANTQTLAISNATVGQFFTVEINNVTSQGALTWFTTIRWAGGSAPTLTGTNGKRDVFGFRVTGSGTYDGFIVGQNL